MQGIYKPYASDMSDDAIDLDSAESDCKAENENEDRSEDVTVAASKKKAPSAKKSMMSLPTVTNLRPLLRLPLLAQKSKPLLPPLQLQSPHQLRVPLGPLYL